MGKSAPSPPPAPDPVATANAQAAANKETAIAQAFLNNTDETNPLGSRTFESFKDPSTGLDRFRSNTTLNPDAQAAFDAEQAVTRGTNELAAGQIGRVSDAVSNPFSFDGLPNAPTASLEGRNRVEDALFNRASRRLDDRFTRDENQLRGRLITQGIDPNTTEAGQDALKQFNFTKNDAFQNAADQAIFAGGAEQNRLFGLQGAERERGIQEQSFLRNIPLNEVAALLGTGSVGIPQFGAPAQTGVAPTNVIDATLGAANIAQQNFQTQQASRNAFNSGLFGLGGSALTGAGLFFG